MKNIIKLVLLVVVILSTNIVYAQNANTKLNIMYFHATQRCAGCIAIEDFTRTTLNNEFAKELKDSIIVFKSIDFLEPENEKYQEQYKFDVQTLILSRVEHNKETKWLNLEKIWDYSDNYEKYRQYLVSEINKLLKE